MPWTLPRRMCVPVCRNQCKLDWARSTPGCVRVSRRRLQEGIRSMSVSRERQIDRQIDRQNSSKIGAKCRILVERCVPWKITNKFDFMHRLWSNTHNIPGGHIFVERKVEECSEEFVADTSVQSHSKRGYECDPVHRSVRNGMLILVPHECHTDYLPPIRVFSETKLNTVRVKE